MSATAARRTYRVLQRPSPEAVAIVRITASGKATDYHVEPFSVSPEMGVMGLEFEKSLKCEPYHVLLTHRGEAVCDCRGFSKHGHCKHADLTPILAPLFRQRGAA